MDHPMTLPQAGHDNVPDASGINLYRSDPVFSGLLRLYLGEDRFSALEPTLIDLGQRASDELDQWALTADKNPPVLRHRTRRGEAIQSIVKHPSYTALERVAFGELGLAGMSHRGERIPSLVKYALTFLFVQAEFGLCCPLSMTDSLARTLRRFGSEELVRRYLPFLISRDSDTAFQGAMFMTEQAAGSDVARIATRAVREGGEWRLYGEKWFCSNPDADLAMVLARPEGAADGIAGIALFLMPKVLEGGARNSYRIVRLKDKLGSRSMASGEIVLDGALAYLIGEVGRGFHQMADMINMSRLSNGVRAAGLMRRAATEALHVARERHAFGQKLADMTLMLRQLTKILLPAEQARSMFMHTARCLDRADAGDAEAAKLVRILTPLIKFRACRDARRVTGDAMEVRGGVGYIEEWSDPRLVRDSHLGSIWEGTSNIVALDIARAARREACLEPLSAYLARLLDEAALPEPSDALMRRLIGKTIGAVTRVAERQDTERVRQAGSALYHLCSAVFMAWEAARMAPDFQRLALGHLVVRHRLMPFDPLALEDRGPDAEALRAIVEARTMPIEEAMRFCPE
ncbi:acyl-CoA dehydrogenase family protein [Acidiphilium sp. AL]|uniref:Acyl-CoA dehydrogenase family protein n=1 Tax=Acidiphilium iwatense TaxID=768198 RepID=A0ABS9DUM1_9PROT|nr:MULTISPECIES: acyl-CoA dehydrogenase family protein [Acidiphilium]MCF3945416.1 acyl-CoA dehydrogenase family protein [Acidiphilium iwatense]MCU4158932.1 acyl-CoA dehydrogenase family protein [Acidiphilium sp. AL]